MQEQRLYGVWPDLNASASPQDIVLSSRFISNEIGAEGSTTRWCRVAGARLGWLQNAYCWRKSVWNSLNLYSVNLSPFKDDPISDSSLKLQIRSEEVRVDRWAQQAWKPAFQVMTTLPRINSRASRQDLVEHAAIPCTMAIVDVWLAAIWQVGDSWSLPTVWKVMPWQAGCKRVQKVKSACVGAKKCLVPAHHFTTVKPSR